LSTKGYVSDADNAFRLKNKMIKSTVMMLDTVTYKITIRSKKNKYNFFLTMRDKIIKICFQISLQFLTPFSGWITRKKTTLTSR